MYLKERGEDKADPEILAKMSSEVLYKIDVPANRFFQFLFSLFQRRYDLLCVEGIARALR